MKFTGHMLIILVHLLHKLEATTVGFKEDDIGIPEDDESATITISISDKRSDVSADVLVVPMTLSQYLEEMGSLPPSVDENSDPAEPGLDFNDTVQLVTIEPDMDEVKLKIPITADNISELEEVFILVLRPVVTTSNSSDESALNFHRNISVARIKNSATAKMRLSRRTLNVTEGTTVTDQLFIEIDREIEPTVIVELQNSGQHDIQVPASITISRTDGQRVPVPINVTDDSIAEEDEAVALSLFQDKRYSALYTIDLSSLTVLVKDNDVPRIGFVNEMVEVFEGEEVEVCVALLEPEQTEVFITASLTLASPGLIPFRERRLTFYLNRRTEHCYSITTSNDDEVNPAISLTFNLTATAYRHGAYVTDESFLRVDPREASIIIRDNDGVPFPPSQIMFENQNDKLLISWTADESDLRPIDGFVILVKSLLTGAVTTRTRRQSEELVQELVTNKTYILIENIDFSKEYEISVCSENQLDRVCSQTQRVHLRALSTTTEAADSSIEKPSSVRSSTVKLSSVEEAEALSPVMLVVLILVPLATVLLCVILVFVCILCKCWHESRAYYPSKQEKMVMGVHNVSTEAKYCKRQSFYSSTMSIEWNMTEPINMSTPPPPPTNYMTTPINPVTTPVHPVTTHPNSPPHILGTPV